MSNYSHKYPILLIVEIPFFIINGISKFLAKVIFYPLKDPINEIADLKSFSWHWKKYSGFFRFIRLCCGLYFFGLSMLIFFSLIIQPFELLNYRVYVVAAAFGMAVAVLCWIEEYGTNAEIQKMLSGKKAEECVKIIVENVQYHLQGARTLHGKLFIFNRDQANEFSVELDHILVTRKNVYFIETKQKTGVIHFDANKDQWVVKTKHGDSSMRNALNQIKNSTKVMQEQLGFQFKIIPIVAIVSENASIVDAPGNVVLAKNLPDVLKAFESIENTTKIDVEDVLRKLNVHMSNSQSDFSKHIDRANKSRETAVKKNIVDSSLL
jgi:hypothetical protein